MQTSNLDAMHQQNAMNNSNLSGSTGNLVQQTTNQQQNATTPLLMSPHHQTNTNQQQTQHHQQQVQTNQTTQQQTCPQTPNTPTSIPEIVFTDFSSASNDLTRGNKCFQYANW